MVQKNNLNKVIVVCGPTCSGKTALSIKLAKQLNTEIISADSVAIYKGLDIGSAKPSITERDGVVHHMIDVVSPDNEFSVSDYEEQALPILKDLLRQNKTPIICGGTGFYINSLLYKKSYGNAPANEDVRNKYSKILQEKGVDYLYSILEEIDPVSAKTIHKNNTVRVIRALEIFEVSGQKKSEIIDENVARFNFSAFTYDLPREVLYDRINKRVDSMLKDGLIDEVKGLISKGITLDNQCMQGIGYKEVYQCIQSGDYDALPELIKINTRHYAKRQMTFFKKFENLTYIPFGEDVDTSVNKIINTLI